MIERFKTLENWNEDVMPSSKTREQKINDALFPIYKYLKSEYILCNKNFTIKTKDFYDQYQSRMKDNTSKQKLGRHLSKINILPIKVKKGNSQFYKYDMKHSDLKAIFEKNKWIDEKEDLYEYDSDEEEELELGVCKGEQSVNVNLFLKNERDNYKNERDELKRRIEELEKNQNNASKKKGFGIVYEEDYDDDAEEVTIITKRKSKR